MYRIGPELGVAPLPRVLLGVRLNVGAAAVRRCYVVTLTA